MRRLGLSLWHSRHAAFTFAFVAPLACTTSNDFGPPFDCSESIGAHFIALSGEGSPGYTEPTVAVGDSVQLDAVVRRVTASSPVFNPQAGWSCHTDASVAVAALITFTSSDTTILDPRPNGWLRGLNPGVAFVTATSAQPLATRVIIVLVTSTPP
jgi:hypothetical protein